MKGADMILQRELAVYKAHKEAFIEHGHAGKFVVIKGDEVFDIFRTYEDALRQGLKKYGNVPFLIKEISQFEMVNFFFHGLDLPCQASASTCPISETAVH
jgi:hypothetical protein